MHFGSLLLEILKKYRPVILHQQSGTHSAIVTRSVLVFFNGNEIGGTASANKQSFGSVAGKAIGKLSRGYRQRVGMAQVLLGEPDVLILDEPTAGLDPNQIREVRKTIRGLGKNKTVLLSTHILQEVEAMADRILMISEGRLVFDGSTDEIHKDGHTLDDRFAELTTEAA